MKATTRSRMHDAFTVLACCARHVQGLLSPGVALPVHCPACGVEYHLHEIRHKTERVSDQGRCVLKTHAHVDRCQTPEHVGAAVEPALV